MSQIASAAENLTLAGIDYVELGFLTSVFNMVGGTQFQGVETAVRFIPKDRGNTKYLLMADVALLDPTTLCERSESTIDGVRVVFYKRQIEQTYAFCEEVVKKGYDLFLQPMVTVDYSLAEFENLITSFNEKFPLYAVSAVDSFGCMTYNDIVPFIKVIEKIVDTKTKIGFHAHDNMQLSLANAVGLLNYQSEHELVLDATVDGIGRGAGNLNTELIVNYVNNNFDRDYKLEQIFKVMSDITEPLSRKEKWDYSPYFFLTALRKAHPNFATYLFAKHDMSVEDFSKFLDTIPNDMLTKCTRPYVEELYENFIKSA
jgi:4-hydroxy 2-oxovalerate aldolase